MKKYFVLATIACLVLIFSNCHSSKKVTSSVPETPKFGYDNNVKAVITNYCTPCHIPSKGGNKKALDSYDAVKTNIDDILHRIQLNPGDQGFMPFKHAKLSDSTIAVFRQWKDNGMLQ
jgi:hypothetical protein